MTEIYQVDELDSENIAIIGVGGRFPDAEDVEQYWKNLLNGHNAVCDLTDEQLREAGHEPGQVRNDPNFVTKGTILQDVDSFDASLFGYNPQEATLLDPQHRLLLEVSWSALENAGYDTSRVDSPVGVYVGKAKNSYLTRYLLPNRKQTPGSEDLLMVLGNETDYLSTTVSYRLGLTGPSVNVHTACSTSLVAVHHAKQSLLNYECDMALAGGVCVRLPQGEGYEFNEGNILSSDGHTRTFDANADGTMFGNGAGIVVLKRLSDAIGDRDRILAVIRGSAVNNDGPVRQGFMAPSVEGQAQVIQMALADAELSARELSYVEGHGTATPLGDPIEVAALTQAHRQDTNDLQYCALGSVKSNIGHLDAAAGISGLIKTVLAMHHRIIPASINCEQVNPRFNIESTPFYINQHKREWPAGPSGIRYAGVSSFGAGGTNAHVILQEAPLVESPSKARPYALFAWSGNDTEAVNQNGQYLSEFLSQRHFQPQELADVAFTLNTGRKQLPYRQFIAIETDTEWQTQLDKLQNLKTYTVPNEDLPTIFLFPGQGSQYPFMASTLYYNEPEFRKAFDYCVGVLNPILDTKLENIIYPDTSKEDSSELLNQTKYTQPALFVIEYCLAKWWMSLGLRPSAMLGHSIGEYVAACLADVFSLEDALKLVKKRGELIQSVPGGTMLSVFESAEIIIDRLTPGISLCAVNTPESCVVGGSYALIEQFKDILQQRGIEYRELKTSHAFHSSQMEPILDDFEAEVRRYTLNAPSIPFISCVSGQWITDAEATDPAYWSSHIRQAVRFASGCEELQKLYPTARLLESGPGNTLCSLARASGFQSSHVVSSLGNVREQEKESANLMSAMGELWVLGVDIDWSAYYQSELRNKIALPTYRMQRKRYWINQGPVLSVADKLQSTTTATSETDMADKASDTGTAENATPIVNGQVTATDKRATEISRMQYIAAVVTEILSEISGMDANELIADSTFIQLGFDSLFLTQASTAIRKKFDTPVTFRQMLETTTTISELAAFLDEQLEPGTFLPSSQTATPSKATEPEPEPESAAPIEQPKGDLQQILSQHVDLLSRQVALINSALGDGKAVHSTQDKIVVSAVDNKTAVAEKEKHGPWKQIARTQEKSLDENQKNALKELLSDYERKTVDSKKHAMVHRAHFADPRGISSFDRRWKELIYPLVTTRSSGSRMWDVDGNEYIDIQSGFGSVFFGHNMPFIRDAISEQLASGMQIGPQSLLAGEVAKGICELSGLDRATFCNTGSEAVLAAMRVARTVSGNNKIAMFAEDYHGIFDEVVSRRAGSMETLRTIPAAPGIPPDALANIIILDYGDDACFDVLDDVADELAAVLIEPVQSRKPEFQPKQFLHKLRAWTEKQDVAFIFDEVITGFRLHPRGAQGWYGISADLCCYGKVIGGGMPAGVLAGSRKYMDALDGGMWQYGDESFPEVGVTYFAGTFVRHPLTIAACYAAVRYIKEHDETLYDELNQKSDNMAKEINQRFLALNAPIKIQHCGSMFCVEFLDDGGFNPLFYFNLRLQGVHILEAGTFFLTLAHSDDDISKVVTAFENASKWMLSSGFHSQCRSEHQHATLPIAENQEFKLALTENQQELWLASQMNEEAGKAYNLSNILKFKGELNRNRLRQSLIELINLHDSLRLSFSVDGAATIGVAVDDIDFQFEDFSHQSGDELTEHVKNIATESVSKPFELDKGPLIRFRLLKTDDKEHQLFITNHHIISDGWSNSLIIEQLGLLYDGKQNRLGKEVYQFRDYAGWLNEPAQQKRKKQDEAYWLELHKTPAPPLELPTDRSRPALKSYSAHTVKVIATEGTLARVNELARQQGVTQYHVLLSAFQLMLHKLSGQDDITIGIPVAGQLSAPEATLIGHCVNFAVLRSRVSMTDSVNSLLQSTRKSVFDAFEHTFFGYGELIKALNVPGDTSRNPLVSAVFNVDLADLNIRFSDLDVTYEANDRCFEIFDIFMDVIVKKDDLTYTCTFNRDLYDAETIERWLSLYQTLLDAIIEKVDATYVQLPANSVNDEQRLLEKWCHGEVMRPAVNGVSEALLVRAQRLPEKTAVESGKDEGDSNAISYVQLHQQSNRLARYLNTQGIAQGQLVALSVKRSPDLLVWLLGILKSGAAYLPLDAEYPSQRLEYMLRDARPSLLITDQDLSERIPLESLSDLPMKATNTENLKNAITDISPDNLDSPVNPQATAYIIYTSGSTGNPKGVMVSHKALMNLLSSLANLLSLSENDRLLAITTLSFDIAALELYVSLLTGGTVVLADSEDAGDGHRLVDLIEKKDINLMQATPATWKMLLDTGFESRRSLKALCGGEALSDDLAQALQGRVGELWNMYGPTETTIWSTMYQIKKDSTKVLIGKPIHNTSVFILDDNQQLAPLGAAGELYIGGHGLAKGYFERDELTNERFIEHPFDKNPGARLYRTGDQVRFNSEGNIEYLGRLDRQVKLRGHRIELAEIEVALRKHEEIKDCAVVIKERGLGDMRLIAYIIWEQSPLMLTQVRRYLRSWVPDYMVPQLLVELEQMPRTLNGKLDVNALPDPFRVSVVEEIHAEPQTNEERWIADQWKEILSVDRVDLYDNFFDLGGHSLLAIQFIHRVRNELGISLHSRDVILENLQFLAGKIHIRVADEDEKPMQKSAKPARKRILSRLFRNS